MMSFERFSLGEGILTWQFRCGWFSNWDGLDEMTVVGKDK